MPDEIQMTQGQSITGLRRDECAELTARIASGLQRRGIHYFISLDSGSSPRGRSTGPLGSQKRDNPPTWVGEVFGQTRRTDC